MHGSNTSTFLTRTMTETLEDPQSTVSASVQAKRELVGRALINSSYDGVSYAQSATGR